jgi:LmbE family N-acetylglucosaminyl deacetylase
MNLLHTYAGQTVLAIGAHPDDLEIGAGGTLAQIVRHGGRVVMAAVTIPNMLEQRIIEARAAADILGAQLEVLERERCCRVEDLSTYELVEQIDGLIRKYEPVALFTHSAHEVHYDHILVHRAVLSSLRLRPMDVYLMQPTSCKPVLHAWQARIWVDIGETLETKIRAIAAHESQFGRRGICLDTFRQMARSQGLPMRIGYAEGHDVMCLRS